MTLHYPFPCIHWWHTVAKHFEGNENFVVADKGDYFVVNYVRMGKDTHPPVEEGELGDYARAAVLREGRGLIFCSKTGELLSRPFHKFFNLGEREDVMDIDLSKPHAIMEKLDGCLSGDATVITPYGVMSMAEICEQPKSIPVLAYDFSIKRDVWAEVMDTSIKESVDNWYRITLKDGKTLELTDNHKIWCVNKNMYLTVADLEEEDEVRLPEG